MVSAGLQVASNLPALTPREREVLDLLAHHFMSKEIARKLCISRRTVDGHVSNILQKAGVHTRLQAVRKYEVGK